jgi:hypothetical protein
MGHVMQILAVGSAMALLMEVLSHASAGVRVENLRFLEGQTLATVSGSVSGYDAVRYVVGAGAGQTIAVRLIPDSDACVMRVSMPGADETGFFDARVGHDYVARHAKPGTYTTHIHLTHHAARHGETCAYRLTIDLNAKADVLETARRRSCNVCASLWKQ